MISNIVMMILMSFANLLSGIVGLEMLKYVQAAISFWVSGFCGAVAFSIIVAKFINKE